MADSTSLTDSHTEKRLRKNAAVRKCREKAKCAMAEKNKTIQELLQTNEELRNELKECKVKLSTITDVLKLQVCVCRNG